MSNKKDSLHKLHLRNLNMDDYTDVKRIMNKVYSNAGGAWTKDEFKSILKRFPEGQICIEDNGKLIAGSFSLIVNYADYGDNHSYKEITGNGMLSTHNPKGDTLYGIDIFVDPEYAGMRLGRRLYDARKELCENLNLRKIVVGGRIPGYKKYSKDLSPREYIEQVREKELYDPILTFQLNNDFHIRKVLTNYLPDDKESKSYATLLEWLNVYYDDSDKLIGLNKTLVRLGVVQWKMRRSTLEELYQNIEFFVDTISGYKADFVLFPEFFNAPLMANYNKASAADAVRSLAEYTEAIKNKMMDLALSYNINIIAGSMPLYTDDGLFNVSYLCRRDGTIDVQYKLHVTPDEQTHWGMRGGDKLKVFNTDAGRIGILICYDVEFPELSRILAEQQVDIIFVPYWTDTRNSYLRVSRCAQARAIENECFVATAGSIGNLPGVENMDIQYAQSAIYSPSDFNFPPDAIVADATPNSETTLVVDLDLSLLKRVRSQGSVRNLESRRKDLYAVTWLKK
ncbi:MAG: bifunctional GNAT family N-acetyltransferase/carbon-nitrogen hydrolase family protein [Cytophagaceae bacterium]|jgi:predicted amidohydrolase/ribosomal protein S18 acetylase RimI-like enzyme|nr:bifunctional GNAT family N-acetyltransferase/carbon-nitrogen hydrolase family protein [Cytophagaceae bacterium]